MPRRGLVAGPDLEYFQRRYFTPAEVAQHNRPEDLWVSYLGRVYDLTSLAQEYKGKGHTLGRGRSVCVCVCARARARLPGSRRAGIDSGCAALFKGTCC